MSRVDTLVSFFGDRRPPPGPAVPSTPDLTPEQSALVAQGCTKSGVVWVRPFEVGRARLVWHVWHDDAVHVVYGVGEQFLPMLSGLAEVAVPSKDTGTRLITFVARAEVLVPNSPQWQSAATALTATRLNALDPPTQHERWARGSFISRLAPLHVLADGAGAADAPAERSAPPPSPGTTATRRPWHLGGRSGRARRLRQTDGHGDPV